MNNVTYFYDCVRMIRPDGVVQIVPGMVKAVYIIAVILLAGWALGFLVFHVGYRIHVLLILAMMAVLGNIIREG